MTRAQELLKFNKMVTALLIYLIRKNIPFRLGEAHRPFFVAQKYLLDGVGILSSLHRKSMAIDIWITTPDGEKIPGFGDCPLTKIVEKTYHLLGIFWARMGGIWGGTFKRKDPFHFEYKAA